MRSASSFPFPSYLSISIHLAWVGLTEAPGEQGIDVIGLFVPCVPLPVNAVSLVIADIWYLQCHCHSGFKFLPFFFPCLTLIAFLLLLKTWADKILSFSSLVLAKWSCHRWSRTGFMSAMCSPSSSIHSRIQFQSFLWSSYCGQLALHISFWGGPVCAIFQKFHHRDDTSYYMNT